MKALTLYAEKRLLRLEYLMVSFNSANAPEGLHQIRVEIKKIKAILRLIHFHDKDFQDHKHYKPLRNIFRKAGDIRKADVMRELLLQYTVIKKPVASSSVKSIKKFEENLSGYLKDIKKQKRIILKEVCKIKSRTYKSYLQKKNEALNEFLAKSIEEKDLHFLRKLVKEVIYLSSATKEKTKINTFLLEIELLIGNWHDKRLLMDWMKENMPAETIAIQQLEKMYLDELQNIYALIKNKAFAQT